MSSSTIALNTLTQNTDRRSVLSDSVSVGDGSNSTINTSNFTTNYSLDAEIMAALAGNIPDAMVAVGQTGATVLRDAGNRVSDVLGATIYGSTDVLARMGDAVVNLNKDSVTANSRAWDSTLLYGAGVIDKAIDGMAKSWNLASENLNKSFSLANDNIKAGYSLAEKTVDSFTPTENKNADIGKYAMWAAAAVCLVVLFSKKS